MLFSYKEYASTEFVLFIWLFLHVFLWEYQSVWYFNIINDTVESQEFSTLNVNNKNTVKQCHKS